MTLSYVGSICSYTSSAVAPFCMHEEDMNHPVASARRVGKQSFIDDVDSPVAIKLLQTMVYPISKKIINSQIRSILNLQHL